MDYLNNGHEDISEPEHLRKMFIGGLDYHTTDESLKAYFEKYGEIVDVVVMKDNKTKRSRGFGFVAFSKAYMVDEAQKNRPHVIDGRSVETKRAVPRDEISKPEASLTVKKLFVGGIKDDVEEEDLREVFTQFGEVVSVSIPTEKESQKKRAFAFVEFEDYDAVDKACLRKDIMVKNKRVEVKKALSKAEMQQRATRGGGSSSSMSGGMGRGSSNSGGSWGGQRNDSWGSNQSSNWGDNRGSWGSQGSFGGGPSGPGGYGNQGGGYSGQNSWQGSGQGGNQGWNSQPQGWGGQQSGGYGGGGGSNNWGGPGPNDFGNNYGQSYGGGPARSQGFGQTNRPAPYSTGGPGGPGGYNTGGYSGNMGSGPGNRRY